MPDVMITKFLPPRFNHKLIERRLLVKHLTQNQNCKLILFTAPAGYGKTVLAIQYVKAISKPLVWYQLDSYDNDLIVFIRHMVAGVQNHIADFGEELLQSIGQGNPASRSRFLVTCIINSLAEKRGDQGLVLVLDDYNVITNTEIHNLIQEILEHLPHGIQVIITSRIVPPLSLARLKVAGEILILGIEELGFNIRETREFMAQKHHNLSRKLLETLQTQTVGWPVALRLLIDSSSDLATSQLNLRTKEIFDYLASEVFDRQPENIQEFLLATSVLEIMTPESCDQLLERNDAASIFDILDKQQLFLTPLAGGTKTYRYHQLFREFLLDRLGSSRELLLRQASKIALQKGDFSSAVDSQIREQQSPDFNIKTSTKAVLQIQCLGPLRIIWNQTEITIINWRTSKARDLLVYLAQQGEPIGIERILEDLWPKALPDKKTAIFHTTLYRLRSAIKQFCDQELIKYGSKSYYLIPKIYIADFRCFEELLKKGLKNNISSDTAMSLIEDAVALYRGDYLADFDYSWIIPCREHLKRLYMEANLKLAHLLIEKGQYNRVVEKLGPLIGNNPFHENIHCLLMTAYAGSGDRFTASKQYQSLKTALENELGLKPAPETRRLYYKLCGV